MSDTAKTLDLRNLTESARNAALNEAVARVAGDDLNRFRFRITHRTEERKSQWSPSYSHRGECEYWREKESHWSECGELETFWDAHEAKRYATSCDAIMPLLEKSIVDVYHQGRMWSIWIDQKHKAEAATLPLAACIALLKANNWEVIT